MLIELLAFFFFAGVLALLCIALVIVLVFAYKRRNWKRGSLMGGAIVAAMLLIVGLGYLWFRPYDPTSPAALQEAYKADFGTLPPVGVTVLKARQVIVGDAGCQWLLLQVTPEEIDRLIGPGFQEEQYTPPEFKGDAGANAPEWWKPPRGGLKVYLNTNWSKAGGWHYSQATIGVDRTSNTIWFFASKT